MNKWYLIIPLAFLTFFFVAPLVKMFYLSLFNLTGSTNRWERLPCPTMINFLKDGYYWGVLGKTVGLSFYRQSSALSSDILFHIISAECRGRRKVSLRPWSCCLSRVSITVRMFGLMTMIECGTYLAVEIGLIYCGPPYMIMILTGPIGNVSQSVEEASYVCGAGFWETFLKLHFH